MSEGSYVNASFSGILGIWAPRSEGATCRTRGLKANVEELEAEVSNTTGRLGAFAFTLSQLGVWWFAVSAAVESAMQTYPGSPTFPFSAGFHQCGDTSTAAKGGSTSGASSRPRLQDCEEQSRPEQTHAHNSVRFRKNSYTGLECIQIPYSKNIVRPLTFVQGYGPRFFERNHLAFVRSTHHKTPFLSLDNARLFIPGLGTSRQERALHQRPSPGLLAPIGMQTGSRRNNLEMERAPALFLQ